MPVRFAAVLRWSDLCAARPLVMGIVNVTPDSFSDGGRFLDTGAAVEHGLALVDAGADLLDVGGESTRPGAEGVETAEELRRVVPVVTRLAAETDVPVSVDTTKAAVATAAVDAGATVVNDVSAGRVDPELLGVVADRGAGIVLMHMQGEPRTMQDEPTYDDVVDEVARFLVERVEAAERAGIDRACCCVDPGIGFGKTVQHNLALLAHLRTLVERVDTPVLVGASRKRFLGAILRDVAGETGEPPPDRRDDATLATVVWALDAGASIVRVHDAGPAARAVALLEAMRAA
jgi:dihydropteroate synthase